MKFDNLINSLLNEGTRTETLPNGEKKHYIDSGYNDIYTGEVLRADFGCDWIGEEDDETEFIVKYDGEVVRAYEDEDEDDE